ncbi:MAG: NAD-dependent deacylase [Candidatus Cloacimonetes bacterium]|nr:NAD-dependent deacylase [Candidatus Cloacimonadota bacterium]
MKKYLILTGAGISAESGIRTFRDNDGLWEDHDVNEVASIDGYRRNPELVWRFYKARYAQSMEVSPNPGHYALVELEKALGDNFHIITQNVDALHIRAGNQRVIEMHGSLQDCFCESCDTHYKMADIDLSLARPLCPKCTGFLRPDIVWFGEIPYKMEQIEALLRKCDLFMVIGTSGVVYPAAGLVMTAKYLGAKTIAVNLEKPDNLSFIDEFHQGKSGEILPKLIKEIMENL